MNNDPATPTHSARNRGHAALRLRWRLADSAEAVRTTFWPTGGSGFTAVAFIVPACLIVSILVAGLIIIIDLSFHVFNYQTFRLGDAYTLANYAEIIQQSAYLHLILRSIVAATIVTVVSVILAYPYAYVMVRTSSSLLRKLLLVGLFLPFFLGEVVRAFGWLIVLGNNGLLNNILAALGLEPMHLAYTYLSVIIGLAQYMLPLAILMLAPALTAIPEEIEMASEGLGAGWFATFWHIVLPMSRPGLIGTVTVVFTIALTNYSMPAILGGGTNDFIANAIYDAFLQLNAPGLGAALSVVIVIIGSTLVALLYALAGMGTRGRRRGQVQ